MKKLYYSIGEVARMTGLEAHVLRYWESVFPMLRPTKSRSGARRYKEQDLRMVLFIQDLVHRQRYSTAGALKVLREQAENAGSASDSPPQPPGSSARPEPAGASESGEPAESASAQQVDMFATERPQKAPAASSPPEIAPQAADFPTTASSPPAGAFPRAKTRRFADNRDRLTPQMRLELLTIRELLKQLRDLL